MNIATLSTLSLVDLKKQAKGRRIKQYYIMKRVQLIQLLSLPELPTSFVLEKLTIQQLRDEAKNKGIRGFWTLSRGDLLTLLHPAPTLGGDKDQRDNAHHKEESTQDSDPK